MIANIHHALAQVRELQRRVLESQRFRGYSGRARAFSGTVALIGAGLMWLDWLPRTALAHLAGWGVVFAIAIVANYGALLLWFFSDPATKRDARRLLPTLDPLPSIFVGGVLTLVMILGGHYQYLPGIWMCLFGVANTSSRWLLPQTIRPLGLFYIVCGAACLLTPALTFTNPWPMGIVFFIGEWIGGFIFYFNRAPGATARGFFLGLNHQEQGEKQDGKES